MRELKNHEVNAVSGAGLIADGFESIASGVGTLIDYGATLFGRTTTFSTAKATLGKGIGQLVELNFSEGFTNLATGIGGVFTAIQSLFSIPTSSDTVS